MVRNNADLLAFQTSFPDCRLLGCEENPLLVYDGVLRL
jgi:hypothetical protein